MEYSAVPSTVWVTEIANGLSQHNIGYPAEAVYRLTLHFSDFMIDCIHKTRERLQPFPRLSIELGMDKELVYESLDVFQRMATKPIPRKVSYVNPSWDG